LNVHFKRKVARVLYMMEDLKNVTVQLQKQGLTLYEGRLVIDTFARKLTLARRDKVGRWHKSKMAISKAALNSDLAPNKFFESGVVKIQRGSRPLSPEEKTACEKLLKPRADGSAAVVMSDDDEEPAAPGSPNLNEMIRKTARDHANAGSDEYVNCDFILASAAEVERLWSIANDILEDNRLSLTPQLFEAIIYLRYNDRLWGLHDVVAAYKAAREEVNCRRVNKDRQQEVYTNEVTVNEDELRELTENLEI
jgi:hypothetical protein